MANSELVMMVQEDLEGEAQARLLLLPGTLVCGVTLRALPRFAWQAAALPGQHGVELRGSAGQAAWKYPSSQVCGLAQSACLSRCQACLSACLDPALTRPQMVGYMVEYEQQLRQVGRKGAPALTKGTQGGLAEAPPALGHLLTQFLLRRAPCRLLSPNISLPLCPCSSSLTTGGAPQH